MIDKIGLKLYEDIWVFHVEEKDLNKKQNFNRQSHSSGRPI